MARELPKVYEPQQVEDRIYKMWESGGYFKPQGKADAKPFTIVMPPPNVTGQLHMGHAMDATLQDTLIRFKRMQGYDALWGNRWSVRPEPEETGPRRTGSCRRAAGNLQ